MQPTATQPSLWRLTEDRAHLTVGKFEATVRIAQPGLGMHDLRLLGRPLFEARLFAPYFTRLAPQDVRIPVDCVVRGTDLIVTYAQSEERPVRVQIYWRALVGTETNECLAGVDVQVSVQTNRRRSEPSLVLKSTLPFYDVHQLPMEGVDGHPAAPAGVGDCWGGTIPGLSATYAEMVHPADVERCESSESTNRLVEIAHHLFPQPLEKGVILRARARALFLEGEEETSAIERAYAQFVEAPLPLTT